MYHFLMTHETSIQKIKGNWEAWVHVGFDELEEFVDAIGSDCLCEARVTGTIFNGTIAIDLLKGEWGGIFLHISMLGIYQKCFDKAEYELATKANDI